MSDKDLTQPPAGEFIMFASGDGRVRVECRFESDTIWLSRRQWLNCTIKMFALLTNI